MDYRSKIVNFEKVDNKIRVTCDDKSHIRYGMDRKKWCFQNWDSPPPFEVMVIFAFCESANNSEYVDTKHVLLKPFQRQSNKFCKELSFLAMILTLLKIDF